MSSRDAHLRRTYGITEREYNKLLKSQGGGCAMCGAKAKANSLHVDHEHIAGYKKLLPAEKRKRVRGILCFRCNKFRVGRLTLEQACEIVDYLSKYETNKTNDRGS